MWLKLAMSNNCRIFSDSSLAQTHTHAASVVSCGVCLYSVIPSRLDVLRCHLISGHSFPPAFLVYLLVCVYLTRSSRLRNKLALNIQTDYPECTPLQSSGEKEGRATCFSRAVVMNNFSAGVSPLIWARSDHRVRESRCHFRAGSLSNVILMTWGKRD